MLVLGHKDLESIRASVRHSHVDEIILMSSISPNVRSTTTNFFWVSVITHILAIALHINRKMVDETLFD